MYIYIALGSHSVYVLARLIVSVVCQRALGASAVWLRSPYSSASAYYIDYAGYFSYASNLTSEFGMVPCLLKRIALGAACGYTRTSGTSFQYSDGYCILRSPFGDESDLVFTVAGEHCVYPSINISADGFVSSGYVTTSSWLVPCLVNVFYFKISSV